MLPAGAGVHEAAAAARRREVALGAAVYMAGPSFEVAAGCLAGFAATLGVQAAIAFRRLLGLSS